MPETRGAAGPVCVTSGMMGRYVSRDIPRGMVGGEKEKVDHSMVIILIRKVLLRGFPRRNKGKPRESKSSAHGAVGQWCGNDTYVVILAG